MLLNESYYGKNVYTDRIESVFAETLKTPEKDNKANLLIKELEDALSDFSGATINIDLDKDCICYTIPVHYTKTPSIKVTKEGIKFTTPNECLIMVTFSPYLIFKDNHGHNLLNPGELTAVVLHEIGHNFLDSVIPLGNAVENLKRAVMVKTKVKMKASNPESYKQDNDFVQMIKDSIDFLKTYRPDSFYDVFQTGSIAVKQVIANLIPFRDPNEYLDEKYADSFAVSYGYGKELASALKKLEYTIAKKNDKESNITSLIGGMMALMLELLFDEHPNTMARMQNTLTQLEYELNHGKYDAKTKAEIKKQISGTRTMMRQYDNMCKSSKYNAPKAVYNTIIMNLIPDNKTGDLFGHLVKDIFNPEILDKAQ